jgi:hypothetical protein
MGAHDLYESRNKFFIQPSSAFRGGLIAAFVVGLIALIAGWALSEPTRVWGALLFNLFFFFSIALGGSAVCAMQDIIGAVWGRPIRRIHDAFASFLPVAGILFIVFFAMIRFDVLGAGKVYSWIADPSIVEHFHGKNVWLQRDFMLVRNIVSILIILTLAHWQSRLGTLRDQAFIAGNRSQADEMGQKAKTLLRYWSAPILVVYSICYSVMAFDLLMSLNPLWFSTLWGGWCFAIMMQTLMATTLIAMFSLQDTQIGSIFKRQQFHDVGKLMHGFTIFFAYLTYAHVLTYWYGNMPEETEYYIHRLHAPWKWILIFAPLFSFVLPLFALIFKPAKWTGFITVPIASLILIAQWAAYMVVVQPETVKGPWIFPWVELGGLCFVLGLFILSFMRFAQKNPMVPLADPLLKEALADHH